MEKALRILGAFLVYTYLDVSGHFGKNVELDDDANQSGYEREAFKYF